MIAFYRICAQEAKRLIHANASFFFFQSCYRTRPLFMTAISENVSTMRDKLKRLNDRQNTVPPLISHVSI